MKISVIIPVYNGEKYIAQCIENILCQTYKDLEIIVIDDGSTDRTAEIAKQYSNVKYIYQTNSGPSDARNLGIDNATGDYIHFMDVDDLINLEFYEKLLNVALATDADMVTCEMIHERLPYCSLRFHDKLVVVNTEDKMQMTNIINRGYCCRFLYRTAFLKTTNLKFEKELRSLHDQVLSFQAVYFANKIAFCPQAVYYYKHRTQSIRTSKTKEHSDIRKKCKIKADIICKSFAKQHNFKIVLPPLKTTQYKLFGIPVLKKRTINTEKERWYLLGIYLWQRKIVRG